MQMIVILKQAVDTVWELGDRRLDQGIQAIIPQSYIALANSKWNQQGQDAVSKWRKHATTKHILDYNWKQSIGAGAPGDA
jgi:hypothetical protein